MFNGKTLKIRQSEVTASDDESMVAGTVVRCDKSGIDVQTGKGQLKILQVHLEGTRPMTVAEFTAGHRIENGYVFKS